MTTTMAKPNIIPHLAQKKASSLAEKALSLYQAFLDLKYNSEVYAVIKNCGNIFNLIKSNKSAALFNDISISLSEELVF